MRTVFCQLDDEAASKVMETLQSLGSGSKQRCIFNRWLAGRSRGRVERMRDGKVFECVEVMLAKVVSPLQFISVLSEEDLENDFLMVRTGSMLGQPFQLRLFRKRMDGLRHTLLVCSTIDGHTVGQAAKEIVSSFILRSNFNFMRTYVEQSHQENEAKRKLGLEQQMNRLRENRLKGCATVLPQQNDLD